MIHITGTVKTLRDMMKPVEAITDDCRLNISPEGLSVKAVDPVNVAMIDLKLPKGVFHEGEYTVDEVLQVGLDVVNYPSLFEGAEDNERAELSIEQYEEMGAQKHRLIIKSAGIFEQTLTLMKPDKIRKEPKLLTFNLRAETEISKEFLKRCYDLAAKAGDYIRMTAIGADIINNKPYPSLTIEAGDEERNFRVELTTDVKFNAESPQARLKSLFSLDYLCDMVKAIGGGEIIKVHLDNDQPLILDFKVLDHGQASYILAPRIESE